MYVLSIGWYVPNLPNLKGMVRIKVNQRVVRSKPEVGSQPFMVCGPLLETLNTSSPLVSNKIFCPLMKSIEESSLQFGTVFGRNLGFIVLTAIASSNCPDSYS